MKTNTITLRDAEKLLRFDPETGDFFWKVDTGGKTKAGDRAASAHSHGYIHIMIKGRHYLAHRLAWLFTYGVMPDGNLDHINGNRSDNRISNLRAASVMENNRNRRNRCDNTTGLKGVGRNKGKFRARIRDGIKQIHLGYFDTKEDAYAAYCKAAKAYHGEFARTE